jgi:5-methylcytosine-specific restriction protein A
MPTRAKAVCRQAGCGQAIDAPGYCARHRRLTSGWNRANRTSSSQRGYGAQWRRTRNRILARDEGLCQPCLRAQTLTVGSDVDHVIPKEEGGSDDDSNLQTICGVCHKAKTQREAKTAQGRAASDHELV